MQEFWWGASINLPLGNDLIRYNWGMGHCKDLIQGRALVELSRKLCELCILCAFCGNKMRTEKWIGQSE